VITRREFVAGTAALALAPVSACAALTVTRHGPIITPNMLPGDDGANINYPSLIKVPEWVANPLGRYYLYFSSHRHARYIRLAYANEITGPWTVYAPGTLTETQMQSVFVTAPEAYVDHAVHQIRLYVQTRQSGSNRTGVAAATDGISFTPVNKNIGEGYCRLFTRGIETFGLFGDRGVQVRRSKNGIDFEDGPSLFADVPGPYVRHVGLQQLANSLRVFFTQKLVAPEHIRMGVVNLDAPWASWSIGTTVEIMRPEMAYEGAKEPMTISRKGPARNKEHALRDPFIYEESGRTWLIYAIAGESGLALAELQ
jgi:hypothetical protein